MERTIQYPDFIHFHSWETKISLELPVGWERDQDADGQAVYVCLADPDAEVKPQFIAKAVAGSADPNGWRAVADRMSGGDERELLRSDEIEVDDVPTRVDVVVYNEPAIGERVVHMNAVAQIDDVLFVLSGSALASERETVEPVFDQAIRSVRFIHA